MMTTYAILLRGINVGGKNKIPMANLKLVLEDQGFKNVKTYIQSGNVVLQSELDAKTVAQKIEDILPNNFKLDTSVIKTLVLSREQLQLVISDKPKGFGEQPDKYHCDVIFLMGVGVADTMKYFSPKEGIDKVWPGNGVIYSQRLSAERTKSRLNKVIGSPVYKSMTIRNWRTTNKLLEMMQEDS